MAIITDQSTLFGFVTTLPWLGQYSASTGSQDFASTFATPQLAYEPASQLVEITSYVKLTHGFNTYFKMQGFNNATQRYEVWFSTGRPLLVPPSGNPLSQIEVVLTWTDR